MAEGQRHATRSFSALAEGVGPARGRWCRPMGAWAGKRQRPCTNMDNARSLDQSCVNHEFIKSKPLGTSSWTGIVPNRASLSSRTVVLRYRSHLESRQLAPGTINLRLGAVRRLAYEAADCGLLSADLAAGIRRVKGVKKLGVRLGNWLTEEQGHALWQAPDHQRLKGKRDRALLALLLACGLRRHEVVALKLDGLQQREEPC